jgi:WD40 repeat protein
VHSPDFAIYFIGLGTGDIIKQLIWEENISPGLTKVEFSPDWSVVAWVSGGEVQLMDVDSGELGNQLLHEGTVGSISWSVDGSMVATSSIIEQGGDYFPVINVWNVDSGEVIFTSTQESVILDLGFSPNKIHFGSLDAEWKFFLWTVDR